MSVRQVGHRPSEHGVTQELEPFVAGLATNLGTPATVRERASQQRRIVELVPEPLAQIGEIGFDQRRDVSCP